jgi:hypothetical protein
MPWGLLLIPESDYKEEALRKRIGKTVNKDLADSILQGVGDDDGPFSTGLN